jgi:hypothetical protein
MACGHLAQLTDLAHPSRALGLQLEEGPGGAYGGLPAAPHYCSSSCATAGRRVPDVCQARRTGTHDVVMRWALAPTWAAASGTIRWLSLGAAGMSLPAQPGQPAAAVTQLTTPVVLQARTPADTKSSSGARLRRTWWAVRSAASHHRSTTQIAWSNHVFVS